MILSKIQLNGEKNLSNIVIIIGPNNAGKTKLLTDIYYELTHSYDRSRYGDFVRSTTDANVWGQLIDSGYFSFTSDEVEEWAKYHEDWRIAQSPNYGNQMLMRSSKHILQRREGEGTALTQAELEMILQSPAAISEWLVKFKKSHIEYASIDERFSTASSLDSIDATNNDNPNLLYVTWNTIKNLSKHTNKLFSKVLVEIMTSRTNHALLLINSSQPTRPAWARSHNFEAINRTLKSHEKFRSDNSYAVIGNQSHGTRAALSLLMILADRTRKIVFVDEPESHIYPAARRYLARQMSLQSKDRQFFVVTHDVDFLEGIADSRADFTVIKLNSKREVKVIDFNAHERRRASSELKNSKALRAGFYDAVVFVEGSGDKYLYESAMRRKKLVGDNVEYGVIDCDGNDRIADSVKFAFDIGTRVTVITDFDTLLDFKKVRGVSTGLINRIIEQFGTEHQVIESLLLDIRQIMKGRAGSRKGLRASGLTQEQTNKIIELLDALKSLGIFIVPYGELYDWFPGTSKDDAPVEGLRNRYFNNSSRYDNLTDFLSQVANNLTTE